MIGGGEIVNSLTKGNPAISGMEPTLGKNQHQLFLRVFIFTFYWLKMIISFYSEKTQLIKYEKISLRYVNVNNNCEIVSK